MALDLFGILSRSGAIVSCEHANDCAAFIHSPLLLRR